MTLDIGPEDIVWPMVLRPEELGMTDPNINAFGQVEIEFLYVKVHAFNCKGVLITSL